MKICIIGAGYVGLTTAVCFAELGNEIKLIDVDREKIKKIKEGISPIYEEGMQEMLEKNLNKIEASTRYDIEEGVIFICVGTPSLPSGRIDLKYVKKAVKDVAKKMKKDSLLVIKSTVFPGITEKVLLPLAKKYCKSFSIAMNPEFLREGKAIYDFMHPDRVVLGIMDERGEETLRKLYEPLNAPILVTSPTEAEMIKYASNAFLAMKISFSNEICNLCRVLGIDVYKVMEGVAMDHRISPHFLNAGVGFGGSCFPKDLKALYYGARKLGCKMRLIKAVMDVNEEQPVKLVKILEEKMDVKGKNIAVLGLAFKPDTDDIRESRSIIVIKELLKRGANIRAYDPKAMENMKKIFPNIRYCQSKEEALENADACLILTDWKEFENIDFTKMRNKLVIEGRRILKNKEGIEYDTIC